MTDIKFRGELIRLMEHFNLPKAAVEVGVAEGRFSRELLDSGFEFLYLVDVWEQIPFIDGCASFPDEWHEENYQSVLKSLEKEIKEQRVVVLRGFSHKMESLVANESLGLIYIDAAHDYNSVKADIKIWWPKLVKGGIMAFHDYANPDYGVSRAVIEHTQNEALVNIIPEDGSIENIGAWIRK